MAGLERRHSGLPPTPSTDRRQHTSFRAESSAGSLTHRESAGTDVRGTSRLGGERHARRAAVLNDQYLLGEELGRGAYGQVYKGIDQSTGGVVAIKEISLEGMSADDLDGLQTEVDLLKGLNHRNVVQYLGTFKTKSHLYIILEFVENGSLSNIIKPSRFGVFPESLVAVYIAQVLEGLVYLHDQGVIHRDIKGANILTTKEGLVKLADFGVATRLVGDIPDSTSSVADSQAAAALVVGTPYWMAPEVIEMSGVSPASDIWSVGCTIVELLTGAPPYFDLNPMTALFRIVQDACPPLPEGISPALDNLLRRCFAKQPRDRPTARQLLQHEWLAAMRRDIKSSWPRSKGGIAAQEGVAIVVERMLEHESSSASSVSGSREGGAVVPPGGSANTALSPLGASRHADGEDKLTHVSGPPSPEHTWPSGPHHVRRASGGSATPSSRRTLDTLQLGAAAAGWTSGSQGSMSLVSGEPSGGRSAHLGAGPSPTVGLHAETSAASRSALLLGVSAAAGIDPSRSTEASWSRSLDTSLTSPLAPPGSGGHQSRASDAWQWVGAASAASVDVSSKVLTALSASAAASAAASDHRERQPRRSVTMPAHFPDSPPVSSVPASVDDPTPSLILDELEAEAVRQIGLLAPGSRDVILTSACERLEGLLADSPAMLVPLLATRGAAPLVQLLSHTQPPSPPAVVAAALRLAAAAASGRPHVAEHLCMLGLLPSVLQAATPPSTPAVRLAAASVLRAMADCGGACVRMLTACRGLSAVASLLETNSKGVNTPMVAAALECLWRVLELQNTGPFPASDAWSRQCVQAGVLDRLALVLTRLAAQCVDARRQAVSQAAQAQQQQQQQQPARPGSRSSQRSGRGDVPSTITASASALVAAADAAETAATDDDADSCFSQLRSAADLWLAFAACNDPVVVGRCSTDAVLACIMPLLTPPSSSGSASNVGPTGGNWLHLLLLRGVRALSEHGEAWEPLQRAGAIPALTPFLAIASSQQQQQMQRHPSDAAAIPTSASPAPGSATPIRSLVSTAQQRVSAAGTALLSPSAAPVAPDATMKAANDALHALFNLCRLHATRAEQAATAGVIPHLVRLAGLQTGSSMEAPALGLLCAMAHASRRARAELARHDVGRIYLQLVARPAGSPWPLPALEALATWLAAEPWQLEPLLLDGDEPAETLVALAGRLAQAAPPALVRLLEGLTRMAGHSSRMTQQLTSAGLVPRALEAAGHGDAGVRLGALKLLRAMYEQHPAPKALIACHDLAAKLGAIAAAERDGDAVLVRSAAHALLDALSVNDAL